MIKYEDFLKVEMNVGTIIEVADFPRARKPSYRLKIDFGQLGIKSSSAQITDFYPKEELVGKQIIAVTNFPAKNIAGFPSEVLILGAVLEDGRVILLQPERKAPDGTRIL